MMQLKSNKAKVYWDKIDKLTSAIAQIRLEEAKTSPAIIGVSKVVNIEDLV
jgi:hypothetical protein